MPRTKSPNHTLIHWVDANRDLDGGNVEPVHAIASGYIVSIEKEYVRLASEIFEDGDYRQTTAIPTAMIRTLIQRTVKLPREFTGWVPSQER